MKTSTLAPIYCGYLVYNGTRMIRIRYRENADLRGFFILLMIATRDLVILRNEGSHTELYKDWRFSLRHFSCDLSFLKMTNYTKILL